MSNRSKKNLFMVLLAGALAFGLSSTALAQNTPSGTTIGNTATLDYFVGGTQQVQIISNTAAFACIGFIQTNIDRTIGAIPGRNAMSPP